jgi:hypothetical protein
LCSLLPAAARPLLAQVPPPVEAEKPVESNEVLTNLDNAKISMFHFKVRRAGRLHSKEEVAQQLR